MLSLETGHVPAKMRVAGFLDDSRGVEQVGSIEVVVLDVEACSVVVLLAKVKPLPPFGTAHLESWDVVLVELLVKRHLGALFEILHLVEHGLRLFLGLKMVISDSQSKTDVVVPLAFALVDRIEVVP